MRNDQRNPLLRTRDGRALLLTQAAHALAQGMMTVIIPWLILESGGSLSQATIGFAITFVPFLLLAVPAGIAGDRLPRRPLLAVALGSGIVIAAALAIALSVGQPGIWVLYAGAFLIGSVRVFVDAAMFGALSTMTERYEMMPAQAALAQAFNLGYFGGPAIAGLALVLGASRGIGKGIARELGDVGHADVDTFRHAEIRIILS